MKFINEYVKFPLYLMTHPVKGFDELKQKNKKSLMVGLIFLIMTCLASIITITATGFVVNNSDPFEMNSLASIIYTVAPILLICVANWSVTTLMDGKASLLNIFKVFTYSLFPYFICSFAAIILSQFITTEEITFYYMLQFIGIFLMCFMIFMGLLVNHEFGLFKMILSLFATVVALCIILFMILIIFDLSQQVYGFFYSLYKEIMLRIGTVFIL